MTHAEHAVAAPALPLRLFVSHYAGSRRRDVPHAQHNSLPSRYIDLIVSLARPIEIARMPGAQPPGAYRAFVAGLQQAPALAHMVHEWHALAGCTPREWILSQLPFLQDYEIGGGHD